RAADVALELDVAPALPQPLARGAGDERVAAVGDEAQERKEQAEKGDLGREVTALGFDELRQEGEEEQRRLGVQQVDNEAVAKQAGVAVVRKLAAILLIIGSAKDLPEAEPDEIGGAG